MNVLPSEILNLIRLNQEESNNYCVKLIEVYEDPEFVHLILEYCQGGSLKQHLDLLRHQDSFDELAHEEQDDPEFEPMIPSENLFKKIIRQILYSVKTMHEFGVAHRDLKLENVMWDHSEVRVIDFGLSDKTSGQKFERMVGTPHYMAPEIIEQSYDEKCDLWAVGVIAYQLFSLGEFPFDGPGEISIYKSIKKDKLYLPPFNS